MFMTTHQWQFLYQNDKNLSAEMLFISVYIYSDIIKTIVSLANTKSQHLVKTREINREPFKS